MWLIHLLNGHDKINSVPLRLSYSSRCCTLSALHMLMDLNCSSCSFWDSSSVFDSSPCNLSYFSKTGGKAKLYWMKYVLNQPTSDVDSVEVNTAFQTIFEDTVCSLAN